MKTNIYKKRKGFVSAFLIVIGVILTILGVSTLSVGLQARLNAVRLAKEIVAKTAADAGLTMAIYQLEKSSDKGELPSAIEQSIPNLGGIFSYSIIGNASSGYTIKSIGNYNGTIKNVECKLQTGNSPFQYAVFGREAITLHNSAKIDWYNNVEGDNPLQVATYAISPGKVNLKNSAYINGDVLVSPESNPDSVISLKNSSKITGKTGNLSSERELKSVSVPSSLANTPSGGNITGNTIIKSSGKYTNINLGNSKKMIVSGNVELYLTGSLTLNNSASIEVSKGSSLTIYISDNLTVKNSSSFNNQSKLPEKLQIYGLDTSKKMTFMNSSNFYGVIYTPTANVEFKNSANFYGSVISNSFIQKNSSKFMYDVSLRDKKFAVSGGGLKFTAWKEY